MKDIDIVFPGLGRGKIVWRLTDQEKSKLIAKYGDAQFRKNIVPKIRAKVRTWYGKKADERNFIVKLGTEFYNLKTGKFASS
jgi:hypothetical protein